MPSAGGDEVLDGVDGPDAAASADGSAVERGRGAGEIELPLQRPALQEPVEEAGMKNVSGAGGVNRLHTKSGGVVESGPVPGQYASFAQRCGGKAAADRKSTRLNSSHGYISYAVFCLKKKKQE